MCLRKTNPPAVYGTDCGTEKEMKKTEGCKRNVVTVLWAGFKVCNVGDSPQDLHQFQNSWEGLRAITYGYGLLQWKATVLNQTRVEMHKTESGKVPLRTFSCLVPMKLQTEPTAPGSSMWQYCPPGSSSEPGRPGFLLGLHQLELTGYPGGWPPSSAPLEAELFSHGLKPPPYLMWPQALGKQRHSSQFQWLS